MNDIQKSFRNAMSEYVSGVVMVTCRVDGRPWGVTISAFCSVSMEPALILVSLGSTSVAARTIAESRIFGVNVLGRRCLDAAEFGSTPGQAKFIEDYCDAETSDESASSPSLSQSRFQLDCTVHEQLEMGDHTVFVGQVRRVRSGAQDEPLAYFSRTYRRIENLMGV
jgi:flavin reductase (DIM6/NTAB) family NADH-FMN oxidoreductase RutF